MIEKLEKSVPILTVILAGLSFVLSYSALREVARQYGFSDSLSFLWPLIIDGSLVVFYMGLVLTSVRGEGTKWYWAMVVVATLATIGFNYVHAQKGFVSIAVSVAPPVMLALSSETLVRIMKRHGVMSAAMSTVDALTSQITALNAEKGTIQGDIERIASERDMAIETLEQTKRQIEQTRDSISETIKNAVIIFRQTDDGLAPLPLDQVTPQTRQEIIVQWANAGATRDDIAMVYTDIFGKAEKTFQRDITQCNGQLKKAWS